ncbi:MAG: hypothetical protein V4489_01225 [Chlamydiota bacterium]
MITSISNMRLPSTESKEIIKTNPLWIAGLYDRKHGETELDPRIASTNIAKKALMGNLIDYCEDVYSGKIKSGKYHDLKFLRPEDSIRSSLKKSDYIPVLEDIWNSGNTHQKILKIKKLMKEEGPFHAPLMFELSLLFYQNASMEHKIETVDKICLPLITVAFFRACQDAVCSINPEGSFHYAEKIQKIYLNRISGFIKKDLDIDVFSPLPPSEESPNEDIQMEVEQIMASMAKQTLSANKLPNPSWIAGLNVLDSNKGVYSKNIQPKKNHDHLKWLYARDMVLHSFLTNHIVQCKKLEIKTF